MQPLNDDMEELFRRASDEYPLNTDGADWNKVMQGLHQGDSNDLPEGNKKQNNYKYLLLLLLLPIGFICGRYEGNNHENTKVGANNEASATSKSLVATEAGGEGTSTKNNKTAEAKVKNPDAKGGVNRDEETVAGNTAATNTGGNASDSHSHPGITSVSNADTNAVANEPRQGVLIRKNYSLVAVSKKGESNSGNAFNQPGIKYPKIKNSMEKGSSDETATSNTAKISPDKTTSSANDGSLDKTTTGSAGNVVSQAKKTAGSANDVSSDKTTTRSSGNVPSGLNPALSLTNNSEKADTIKTGSVQAAGDIKVTKNTKGRNSTQKGSKGKLYYSLVLGPDISTVKLQQVKKIGHSIGAMLGYKVSNKFSIEAGALWDRKNYYTNGKYMDTGRLKLPMHLTILNANGYCDMFEIPLNLKYDFITKKDHSWFASAGVSSYIMKKEDYNVSYKRYSQTGTWHYPYDNSTRNWFSIINLSVGYQKTLGRSTNIRFAPYVKIPLRGVGIANLPISSSGIYISLSRDVH